MKAVHRWALALLVAAAGGHDAGASNTTSREAWSSFVNAVGEGRLEAARLELDRLRTARAPVAALERADRIIAGRAADAQRLMRLSELDLGQADLGAALRRLELAGQFDRSTLDGPVSTRLRAARGDLDAALALLDACRRKREVACMQQSLSRLRQLDRFNADAMLAELAAEDWHAVVHGRRERIEAPSVGK